MRGLDYDERSLTIVSETALKVVDVSKGTKKAL